MKPVEILLIEDNPGDVRLTKEALKESKLKNNLNVVGDGVKAMDYLFKYGKYHIKPSYNNYKAYMGDIYRAMDKIDKKDYIDEYREAAAEIRRRILAHYEDTKCVENGDV